MDFKKFLKIADRIKSITNPSQFLIYNELPGNLIEAEIFHARFCIFSKDINMPDIRLFQVDRSMYCYNFMEEVLKVRAKEFVVVVNNNLVHQNILNVLISDLGKYNKKINDGKFTAYIFKIA